MLSTGGATDLMEVKRVQKHLHPVQSQVAFISYTHHF